MRTGYTSSASSLVGSRMTIARCILLALLVTVGRAFVPSHRLVGEDRITATHRKKPFAAPLSLASKRPSWDDDNDNEDDTDIDLSDQDWRAFRAKLVMAEPTQASSSSSSSSSQEPATAENPIEQGDLDGIGALFADSTTTKPSEVQASAQFKSLTPLDPSQWAYDSGKVIEQGAVILGAVKQDFGFGLRQQYFHKAAILVLDHEESTFTKGIILNRPTDLTLEDDINPGVKWRVNFGGDVQYLNSMMPDIVCLHSLKNERAMKASVPVMKDIQWTTFDNAKLLVKAGAAKPTDFWVFAGYAGWGPGQLMGELGRKSWYMVATDSGTLLKELARMSQGADPRESGLETWTLLMNMIGRGEMAEECSGNFDDLMLKEWAREHLLSTEAGGGAGDKRKAPEGIASTQELRKKNPIDQLIDRVSAATRGEDIREGALVRASPVDRSHPNFLLDEQELHKSVVLLISDDESISIGAILNRPAAKGLDIQITEKDSGSSRKITLPLRYGGKYSVKGSEPLLWLHCKDVLRAANIGAPVGDQTNGIWKCSANDVITAVGKGLATPEEFLVVTGVCVWTKGEKGLARGIQGEIRTGRFEIIAKSQTQAVWDALSRQEVLTDTNLANNIAAADEAWSAGDANGRESTKTQPIAISETGDGGDDEDDSLVFKSDVKVSELSDDALRSWVSTFLLGNPVQGD